MESVKNFFKRASSLALCACVAGTMLSSFNVYAEGYYDTLGGQFYDNGEVVYEYYISAGVYSGTSEDVVFEIDETTTITGIWTYHWDMNSSDEWENAYIWIEEEGANNAVPKIAQGNNLLKNPSFEEED